MQKTGELSNPIKIRAHHLLCMQGFQGYGYSEDFEKHMGMVVTFLKQNPNTNVQIVKDIDEICSHCPYNTNNCNRGSDSFSKMKNLDEFIIQGADLVENKIYTIEHVIQLVTTNLGHESIGVVCDNCSWKDKCLFFQSYRMDKD